MNNREVVSLVAVGGKLVVGEMVLLVPEGNDITGSDELVPFIDPVVLTVPPDVVGTPLGKLVVSWLLVDEGRFPLEIGVPELSVVVGLHKPRAC